MADINKILRKRKWLGKEVGQVIIAELVGKRKAIAEQKEYKPLYTQEKLEKMYYTLTPKQAVELNTYFDLQNAIVDGRGDCWARAQQFYNGYYRYLVQLREAGHVETSILSRFETPIILSNSKYEQLKEEALNRNKANECTFKEILFHVLEMALKHEEYEIKEINDILKSLKKEIPANEAAIMAYKKEIGDYYYMLEDGTRSDSMTIKQWYKVIDKLEKQIIEEKQIDPIDKESNLSVRKKLYIDIWEDYLAVRKEVPSELKELTDDEYIEVIDDYLFTLTANGKDRDKLGIFEDDYTLPFTLRKYFRDKIGVATVEKCYTSDIPKGINKYEILKNVLEYYENADIEEFIAEYTELYIALSGYLQGKIAKFKDISINDDEIKVNYGELEELEIANYKWLVEPNEYEIAECYKEELEEYEDIEEDIELLGDRAFNSGIAIIKEDYPHLFNSKGHHYKMIKPLNKYRGVETLYNDEAASIIKESKLVLINRALKYIEAYNALLDIFEEVYEVEDLYVYKFDLSKLEKQVEAINGLLVLYYNSIQGSKETRARKRKEAREVFTPLSVKGYEPTESKVEEVKKKLIEAGMQEEAQVLLNDYDKLIKLMMGE